MLKLLGAATICCIIPVPSSCTLFQLDPPSIDLNIYDSFCEKEKVFAIIMSELEGSTINLLTLPNRWSIKPPT